jgi:hypothetical protein
MLQAAAAGAILQGWHITGSVLFTLSLHHKQMLMYFAPAFFAYLLGRCLRAPPQWLLSTAAHCADLPESACSSSFYRSFRKLCLKLGLDPDGKRKAGNRLQAGVPGGSGWLQLQQQHQQKERDLALDRSRGCAFMLGRELRPMWRGVAGCTWAVMQLGVAVIGTTVVVWAPFLVPKPSDAIPVRHSSLHACYASCTCSADRTAQTVWFLAKGLQCIVSTSCVHVLVALSLKRPSAQLSRSHTSHHHH